MARAALRDGDILVDGRITEAAWQAAPIITDFVTSEPLDGGEPTRQTEVRILFDQDAIYVAARMWDHPDSIQRQLVRRDERGPYMDWFGFAVDPSRDRHTGYHFKINAAGVQQDIYISEDSRQDSNWNAVWESAVANDSLGWTVEARVPLSQIRYEATDGPQVWGLNLFRRRVVAGEKSHFSLESRKRRGIASQFGDLEDVRVPPLDPAHRSQAVHPEQLPQRSRHGRRPVLRWQRHGSPPRLRLPPRPRQRVHA